VTDKPVRRHLERTAEHHPRRYPDNPVAQFCTHCGSPWPCLTLKLELIEQMRLLQEAPAP
jgi:hypothetical protein